MMEPPVNEIERVAAEWAAKVDGDSLPPDQVRAFEAWIAADPRHLGAYLRVEAALARVSRLGGQAERRHRDGKVVSFLATWQSRRRYAIAGAIAASLAVVVLGGAVWQANSYEVAYRTTVGEMKTVPLPDGSKLTLNTATEVRAHFNPLRRGVTLDRGEALFDVAKHQRRPFVVSVGSQTVRAVGTSFAVARLAGQPVSVTVREGVVAIADARVPGETMVAAGSRAVARADGRQDVATLGAAQLSYELAWLDGRVFFRHRTLASAVREFDRYSSLRIVIDDPTIAARTVTGMYVATDPAGFARAVAVFMDLQLEAVGGKLYLRQKKT